jgi:hypothetical protein
VIEKGVENGRNHADAIVGLEISDRLAEVFEIAADGNAIPFR